MAITNYLSEYTCDCCGKQEVTLRRFAGPNGWLELKLLSETPDFVIEDRDYEFCSWTCLEEYSKKKNQ